jgi:hypothetical protein
MQVFGLDTNIDVMKHHGGTDPLILIKVLVDHHKMDKNEVMPKLKEMEKIMTDHYLARIDRCRTLPRPCPACTIVQHVERVPAISIVVLDTCIYLDMWLSLSRVFDGCSFPLSVLCFLASCSQHAADMLGLHQQASMCCC